MIPACHRTDPREPAGRELSIVVPTLDEAPNIAVLIERLHRALCGIDWEVVVVDDDSADGTAAVVQALGERDDRVRCLRRTGRRGLAGACVEGMGASTGRFIAVMDADLQHDEALLPAMLARLRREDADLAIGTRYAAGGRVPGWNRARVALSRCATRLSQGLLRTALTDPMSGFFMVRAEVARELAPRLSPAGFKLLLDLVTSAPRGLRIIELPYRFSCRVAGRSKLGARVGLQFLGLLARNAWADARLQRPVWFAAVGGSGVLVHLATLQFLCTVAGEPFAAAQATAVLASLVGNFILNNRLTFADRRLHGARWAAGLTRFASIAALGAIANVAIATTLFGITGHRLLAALAGILASAGWNFASSRRFVWPDPAVTTTPMDEVLRAPLEREGSR